MEIKFGAISADSHVGMHRDDFTSRMSKTKWGDKIPHLTEFEVNGELGEGWTVYGRMNRGDFSVANCPAMMGKPVRYPKRWDEVPRMSWDPLERVKALDEDRVDAEVLFPNPPGGLFSQYGDAEFELDAVRAYNDTLAGWTRASDRYISLAVLPRLQEPSVIAAEVGRAVAAGHRGIIVGNTPEGLPALTDPHWDPIWNACDQLAVPVHFHAHGAVAGGWGPKAIGSGTWTGYTTRQNHTSFTSYCGVGPSLIIPQLIFSGITQRFPNLKFVFAENGIGGLNYAMEACDHEWETRHLWTEGLTTRPSETVRRQMYANFWFEAESIKQRHVLGIDNIMWESDLPHVSSYWPRSWEEIERVLDGVPQDERRKMLYENALRVYQIKTTVSV